jgi:hypothetical protein
MVFPDGRQAAIGEERRRAARRPEGRGDNDVKRKERQR